MRCEICDGSIGTYVRPGGNQIEFLCRDCRKWVNTQKADYYFQDNPEEGCAIFDSDVFVTTIDDLGDILNIKKERHYE